MRILVVCQFYFPENFTITKIAESLVSKGHEVHVLTGKPNYGYGHILEEYKKVKDETINGVHVHRVNLYPKKDSKRSTILNYLSYWRNAKRWVRRTHLRFDRVLSMSLSPVTILAPANLAAKRFHIKHVCYCVDLWPESVAITNAMRRKSFGFKILTFWSRKLYSKCDYLLVGSPSFKDYFANELKMDKKHIAFVPQTSLIEGPSEKKIFDDYFNIVYCGNIGTIQGIENVPLMMSKVQNPKIVFHVIGFGKRKDEFTTKIDEYQVGRKVIYHGPMPIDEALPYLCGADAIYVSLNSEGYVGKTIPNKLITSLALSRPILASLEGDGAEVSKAAGGVIVTDNNVDNIAKALDEMSHISKNVLNEYGERNYLYFRDNFSIEKVSSQIENALL